MSIKYEEFPFIDLTDFEYVMIDAMQLENDEGYLATFNFFLPPEGEESTGRGFILAPPIEAETLDELFHKVGMMFACGFFDANNVDIIGNLWDTDGEVIREINWMEESGLEFEDAEPVEPKEKKPTLH